MISRAGPWARCGFHLALSLGLGLGYGCPAVGTLQQPCGESTWQDTKASCQQPAMLEMDL